MTLKDYRLHTEWGRMMINSTSGLKALQLERQFTSAARAVRSPFTHLKTKEIILSTFGSVPVHLLRYVPAEEENNLPSSESRSLTFVGDGATQRVQCAVKPSR